MQIVIDVPWQIKATLNDENQWSALLLAELKEIVNNGTPLPKGHGDLKDADAIMSIIKENLQIRPEFVIEHAPTIIEADTESEDKE